MIIGKGGHSPLEEQLRMVLDDQRRELEEIRYKRRELGVRITELDAEEIDVMMAIEKTKEILENGGK